jgi:hypothetical protein
MSRRAAKTRQRRVHRKARGQVKDEKARGRICRLLDKIKLSPPLDIEE